MVVTEGGPAHPTTLLTEQERGAAFTSSYDKEKAVMLMALEWLQLRRGVANRRTLAAAISKRGSTAASTLRRIIPTTLGSYHQPGQRASACWENPSLRTLGAMFQQQQ